MRRLRGQLAFSATDLSRHLACGHLTNLRREVALGRRAPPARFADPATELLRERGRDHEQQLLDAYVARGLAVATIEPTGARAGSPEADTARERTVEAMRRGADVIYQGRLERGRWSGYPDFLLRVDLPGTFGAWSYEVADAKLARTAKGEALLQLLLYSDLLAEVQGVAPERMHLALGGGGDGRIESFRIAEHAAYYRLVRRRFEAYVDAPPATLPEPVAHCEFCDWRRVCRAHWRQADHLSFVAGLSADQRRRLTAHGVETLAGLAALPLPPASAIEGIDDAALTRIREQARVQRQAREQQRRIRELITPVEADTGLAALPAPAVADVFAVIDGDRYAGDEGQEYLFGFADRDDRHHTRWALDRDAERAAFEWFVDAVADRWQREAGFHVFHYGGSVTTAVKRLMSRYATREDAVDRLLRGNVFVDLRRVVAQGLRASVESYSLPKLEPFFGFEREVALPAAMGARVDFEAWLESTDPGPRADSRPRDVCAALARANRDTCRSMRRLADWLEACRDELASEIGQPLPRPDARPEARDTEHDRAAATAELFAALTAGLPEDDDALDADQRARRLLAHLLDFHRREAKSMWWEYFERCSRTAEEHVEDRVTLGGLRHTGEVARVSRSVIHRYHFPPQRHDFEVGDAPHDPATGSSAGTVMALDDQAGTIDLKRGARSMTPHPTALVPLDNVRAGVLADSLYRLAQAVADNGFEARSPRQAAFDLLRRAAPRIRGGPPAAEGAELVPPGETPLQAVRRIAPLLDRTVLPVQGPPGSGKTYTGARMILDLLAGGQQVGVTANSHKVISNLLGAVCQAAREEGIDVRGIQKANAADACPHLDIQPATTNAAVAAALAGGKANLAGGTAWLWAREEMTDAVDVLVIDEAGQMSLANTLAVSQTARSLVLLGDPRQLDQPLQGVHPPGADTSALGHLLDGAATIAPARGVFLGETWRMHPAVCTFTTDQFYDGRLTARPELERQKVIGPGLLAGQGLRLVPVEHAGNTKSSPEEAARVSELIGELLAGGGAWIDSRGDRAPLTLDDILVVAPYNAHVATLRRALPDGARIGTVDKFQGQEAPIAIYSMASSTPEEAPRGMAFLYSLHRLNVATSRARCVAAIVASPALFTPDCRTPEQMRLANPFCRLREMAGDAADQPGR